MFRRILKEVGSALMAIPGMALGLLVIAVIFHVAVEMSSAWWEWIVSLGIALAISGVALVVIGLAVMLSARRMAEGWLGMFSGRVPAAYARREDARVVAFSGLAIGAIVIPLGLLLFRKGQASGNTNWAITGLFLAGAGALFGLLPAVPGIFYLRNAARSRPREEEPEGEHLETFLVLAFLGISLGLAVSFTFDQQRRSAASAEEKKQLKTPAKVAAPGRAWEVGCVNTLGLLGCSKRYIKLPLAVQAGRRLRVEYITRDCRVQVTRAEGGVQLGWPPRRIRGPDGRWIQGGAYREFTPLAGAKYIISFAPRRGPACGYQVRSFPAKTRRRSP